MSDADTGLWVEALAALARDRPAQPFGYLSKYFANGGKAPAPAAGQSKKEKKAAAAAAAAPEPAAAPADGEGGDAPKMSKKELKKAQQKADKAAKKAEYKAAAAEGGDAAPKEKPQKPKGEPKPKQEGKPKGGDPKKGGKAGEEEKKEPQKKSPYTFVFDPKKPPIRTRVAPSPTGDPHVGTAYMSLFNQAFAHKFGGQFLLRIEDTDAKRSTRESEDTIMKALRWCGLKWDEGPDVGGPYGPYRQSDREKEGAYLKAALELYDKGHAFYCFCTPQRLTEMRKAQLAAKQPPRYDGQCTTLSKEECAKRIKSGEKHVMRMKVPDDRVIVVKDLLRGDVEFHTKQVDMQVLLKGDGGATYHLANVVDDHHMRISHVLRGEEWLNSAPKHLLLYEYFGWEAPTLCHMPLLRNPDRSKLSKRKNPVGILFYQRIGILPEALMNFLGRMGYSMPDGQDKFSFQDLQKSFDVNKISLGGSVFDLDILKALNGQYIRDLTLPQLAAQFQTWAFNEKYLMPILTNAQPRLTCLADIGELCQFFFDGGEIVRLQASDFDVCKMPQEQLATLFQYLMWMLDAERQWNKEKLLANLKKLADGMGLKLKNMILPLYVAVTGKSSSVSVIDSMEHLGPDITRSRIRHAASVIGMLNNAQQKEAEATYKKLFAEPAEGEEEA